MTTVHEYNYTRLQLFIETNWLYKYHVGVWSVVPLVLVHLFLQLGRRPPAEERLPVVLQQLNVLEGLGQVRAERFRQQEREAAADESAAAQNDEGDVVGRDSGNVQRHLNFN